MIIYSLLLLLLSIAVNARRDKSILYSRATITILLYSCLFVYECLSYRLLEKGVGLFGGLYHATYLTQTFHLFIISICAVILQLTAFYPRKVLIIDSYISILSVSKFTYNDSNFINKKGQQYKIMEYPLILLFVISGALFLVSTSDIVSIFLSIELQSYGLYLVSTLYRNSELSTSAGLTYFLLGGLSSCFIVLGTSLLYANSGTTNLDNFYVITSLCNIYNVDSYNIISWYKPLYINLSLVIMCVGFLFKISAAPFHFWSPDVYDAIPTIVTTFVAIIAKISILIFLLQLVYSTGNFLYAFNINWTFSLLMSSFLSLIIGTILGLTQYRIKRLLAYSTISHLGFILLALSINSVESTQAFIFYLMQYSISNLNAFIILLSIGYSLFTYVNDNYDEIAKQQHKNLLDKNNSPIQLINQIKGYYYINPVLALSLVITLFSFVGLPPLIGFFAKQMVLSAALDNGYVFLTIVAILTSVISAVYYLTLIKQMFFDECGYKSIDTFNDNTTDADVNVSANINVNANVNANVNTDVSNNINKRIKFNINDLVLSSSLSITISILSLILLFFIFLSIHWQRMVKILSIIMFNP